MSFGGFVKDQRGWHLDHPPPEVLRPGVPIDDDHRIEVRGGGGPAPPRRRRRGGPPPDRDVRFRYVRPIVAPPPWTEPLPYEDPLERAARYMT